MGILDKTPEKEVETPRKKGEPTLATYCYADAICSYFFVEIYRIV